MKYPLLLPILFLTALAPTNARPKSPAPPAMTPPPIAPLVTPDKPPATGTFRDAAGHSHPWRISAAHALDWDSAPYLPVGGLWSPAAWQPDAPASAGDADRQYLDTLKAHGVFDLCLTAGTVGLTHVSPAAVQKTLDYLDANGFHYGLEIADFSQGPLTGYVIKPGAYRNPAPPTQGVARFSHVSGLASAFYMLVSTHDDQVDGSGDAQIDGDIAAVTLANSGPDDILLLYPQRRYTSAAPESRLPDLWQGYDEYRDRVLTWFQRVHLGPGFRYFLDPLTDKLALNGEVANLVPTTPGFRMDFQAWLDKKYDHNVNDLNVGWGLANRDLPDFAVAARSVPLWFGARGLAAIYDPQTRTRYEVTNKPRIGGHLWEDLNAFRTESVRGYMNSIADALKKGVADVPVVYQWTGHAALFSNDRVTGGYDGLCMTEGDTPALERAAYAYGQAEEAARTTWLLAATSPAASRDAQSGKWDTLAGLGARGFLATRLPAAEGPLDWLNSYAASLQIGAAALAQNKPHILWYPASLGLDIGVRQLPGGLWWLPGFQPGTRVTLGGDLDGYALPDPDGRLPTYVVWSPRATLPQASFSLGKDAHPLVVTPGGAPVKFGKSGDVFTVPISANPVLISRVRSLPLPIDAADSAERQAKRLLALADAQKIPVQQAHDSFFYATNSIPDTSGNADIRYSLLQSVIASLANLLRPYAWIEAENAAAYTFDSLAPDPAASGGAFLSLDTDIDPPFGSRAAAPAGYHADYKFRVNAPGRYTLWAAASPLASSSPFTWSLDDGLPTGTGGAQASGDFYAGRFQWMRLGAATLAQGQHTLAVAVTERRPSDNRYVLAVDAFCVTRVPFAPDGPRQPPVDLPAAPDAPKVKR